MTSFLPNARRWAAVTMLSLVFASSAANAAVYTGNWDPVFNSAFSSDLGWRGSVTVTVDDSCLTPSSVQAVGAGCSAVVNGGVLKFYDTDTNTDFETRPFSGPFLPPIKKFSVDSNGKLDEIDLWLPIPGIATLFGDETWLTLLDFSLSGASLTLAGPWGGHCYHHCPELELVTSQSTPSVAFQLVSQVPEPGSVALVGLAVLALGWSQVRKAGTCAEPSTPHDGRDDVDGATELKQKR